ncbi:PAS domain S-box-containing protein [Hydrogenophaga palleronii]|uniref:histidine kinase n=1 Tax=Hydrogenophaga palleronii TaxID=65655 RepID=A0ABU1WJD5_9BURK|nr:PAS domain S-box protein [Hydrogenophaga palleronii]MDR7149182.1 PAS domain S-box-containing protein [Hydrogenophaga palleronii]
MKPIETSTPPLQEAQAIDRQSESLGWIALLISLAATILVPLVYFTTSNQLETVVTALMALSSWTCWVFFRLGLRRYMAHALVFSVMVVAVVGVVAFGSVRTSSSFLFVGAVAAAGIFMGRKALVAAVAFSVISLGGLIAAEANGLLRLADFQVGLKNWWTLSITLVVVAAMVYYSRLQLETTSAELSNELERRKRTEKKLDLNQERFARIFRTSPSPMIAQSARTGAILDVNPAFERCYGYAREAVLGQSDEMLWAQPEQRVAYAARLFELRQVQLFRCTGLRADGSTFEAHVSSEMGNDREDKLIITTVSDISELAHALEELRRSEERFAKAFNFSPLNMTITRVSDGSFIEVNEGADRVQGFSAQELKGKSTLEVGSWLTQADRDAFVSKLRGEGRIHNYDTRMRHKDGRVIDARLWAELIEIDGEPCILSCTVDISAEKRREALLLDVARGVTGKTGEDFFPALTRHMALSLDADMVIMGELRSEQKIKTLSVWREGGQSRNFNFAPQHTPCDQALREAGLCVHTEQLAARFPDGTSLVAAGFEAYVGQSMRDEQGVAIGVLSAMWKRPIVLTPEMQALMSIFASRANAELLRLKRDREIRHLNETLEVRVRERTADLQRLNSELDSFAYSVSHDLKSPLRSIDGFTQILSDHLAGRLTEEEQALFDRILASTHRMSNLIADMLALARVSQGKLQLQTVDLSCMVRDILEQELARQPERKVELRIKPGLSARCDARLTRIALENLLVNALKYTRMQASPLIEFGQLATVPGLPTDFYVRDNGVGFNMALADQLFKPFQRLHMPGEFEGTGIGLATVRRIIERHGGSISGYGEPGAGATFSFHLEPVCPQAMANRTTPTQA